MVYTLVYRCFRICSVWTRFHTELTSLKRIFHKSGYPENFIVRCFRTCLDNIHLVKENVPIVEGKLGLQQAFKGVLNCCKLEIAFKVGLSRSRKFFPN